MIDLESQNGGVNSVEQGNGASQPEQPIQQNQSGETVQEMNPIFSHFKDILGDNVSENQTENQTENQSQVVQPQEQAQEQPQEQQREEEKSSAPDGEPSAPFKKWEEMTQEELIERAKFFQSRADKTKAEYDKILSALNEREEILRTIYNNPIEAFKRIAPEFSDILDLNQPIESAVASWQQKVLIPQLKQEYPNIVDDDWQPDPMDMMNPQSPTYKYVTRTMEKEKELRIRQELAEQQRLNEEKMSKEMEQVVLQNNLKDKEHLTKELGLTEDQLKEFAKRYDEMVAKSGNEIYPDWHPNRIKNIIKSVFFDEIVNIKVQNAVKEAVEKVHQEYKMKGVTIPKNMPVDVTSIPNKNVSNNGNQVNNGTVFSTLFGRI